ncbi:MAG: hypothetical protein SOZ27_01035 [Spirochaetia bacterium]|nr:hypothetical protein [Spirochaetia bacterium]
MSIIHSISDKPLSADYTLWGNCRPRKEKNVSLILLNRGARIDKAALLSRRFFQHFDSVISVEPPGSSPEIYDLMKGSDQFRFLIPQKELTPGEQIDLAASLLTDEWFYVLWNDQILDKEMTLPSEAPEENDPVIYVPFLKDMREQSPIPTMMVPSVLKRKLRVKAYGNAASGGRTFYPFDFTGCYHRESFFAVGGYDNSFRNPFWQLIDFGARLLMFGKTVRLHPYFLVHYDTEIEPHRECFDSDYLLFVLKNQFVQKKKDRFYIPYISFISYFFRFAGRDWSRTVAECRQANRLLDRYRTLYRKTLSEGIAEWGEIGQ